MTRVHLQRFVGGGLGDPLRSLPQGICAGKARARTSPPRIWTLVIALAAGAVLTCSVPTVAQPRTWVVGSAYPPGHAATDAGRRFGEKVAELTGDRVKVVVHHSGALGLERELVQRVQLGTLDLVA